jgi:hypothetical protein
MHDVTMKMKVTKAGAPFVTNDGLTYHGLNDAQLGYVTGKMNEIGMLVQAHISGHGPFDLVLEATVDGTALPAISKSAISAGAFHDIEAFVGEAMLQMNAYSARVLRAAGKL